MKVQLLDLASQYRKIRKEVLARVTEVCDSQHYVLGKNVSGLEQEIASYCGVKHAVGVASGTDALILSLMEAGVKAGDRVATTPFTFFATAGSIALLGAVPVFVDIHPDTFNIDPDHLETVLKASGGSGGKGTRGAKGNKRLSGAKTAGGGASSGRIKAVMPVHLYGQCADMGPINRLARKYGLDVIEDAAQSIGAAYEGKMAGALGDLGCFSFYPTKNLGGFGDGGMITTNSTRRAERLRMIRGHGSRRRYYHDIMGTNSRLDEIQAAVLRIKLKHLDAWAEGRIKNAKRYDRLFEKAGLLDYVALPYVQDGNHMVYNQYVLKVKKRDALRAHLAASGVGTEIYYPLSLHQQKCFKSLGYKRGDFPVAERVAKEALALPIYPELREKEQKYVVSCIAEFYEKRA